MYSDSLLSELMDWLCPPNVIPQDDQDVRREMYTKNTGGWIFKDESYQEWFSKDQGFLWLHGESTFRPLE
jgi:hypothetical protein